jgi:putative component of membrane protein insertase Oxa1/YidC/SpoIIIJ protein YidD
MNSATRSIPQPPLTARVAAAMIRAYQRWISPYKGFRCAHRKLYGGRSCSEFALHEILDRGVRDAMPGIRNQFRECGAASRILRRRKQAAMAVVASDGYELAPDEPDSEGSQTIDERIWNEQERKRKTLSELPSNESNVTNCSDYAFFSCCTFEFAESLCCWTPW